MTKDSTRNSSSKPAPKSARSDRRLPFPKSGGRKQQAQAALSIFATEMSVEGNIASSGDLHIDGVIVGDVRGRAVTVGENGRIEGELESENLTVHGQVQGTVRARDVALSNTARIDGDVYHETLEIERGASIAGQIHQQAAKAPEPAPETPSKGQPLKVIQGENGDTKGGAS